MATSCRFARSRSFAAFGLLFLTTFTCHSMALGDTVNVALGGKTTAASTQGYGGSAAAGANGIIGVSYDWIHSNTANGGWWTIDLGGSIRIDSFTMHGRSGFLERVNGSVIEFRDAVGTVVDTSTVNITSGISQTVVPAESILARSISISGPNPTDYFNWTEFEIFADNIAAGKTSSQSTTLSSSYSASNAADGDLTNFTLTAAGDTSPWWEVDLGAFYAIDSVILHNRDSDNQDRLENITIQLLGSGPQPILETSTVLNENNGLSSPATLGYDVHQQSGNAQAARYILVSKDAAASVEEYLSLAEVQVFGSALPIQTNAGAVLYNSNPQAEIREQTVTLQQATAQASQASPALTIDETIDGVFSGAGNGWGNNITGVGYTNNVAVWETVRDVGISQWGDSVLEFTLTFASYSDHGLGRFRLSATTADRSEFADGATDGGDVDFTDSGDTGSWVILDDLMSFTSASSLALATTQPGDGSLLIDDTFNSSSDVYTILFRTDLQDITGFRLEIFDDATLTGGGPGLSDSNGNSVLTEIQVNIASIIPEPTAGLLLLVFGLILVTSRKILDSPF